MEVEEFMAQAHRRVVAEFIEAVLGEWASTWATWSGTS